MVYYILAHGYSFTVCGPSFKFVVSAGSSMFICDENVISPRMHSYT